MAEERREEEEEGRRRNPLILQHSPYPPSFFFLFLLSFYFRDLWREGQARIRMRRLDRMVGALQGIEMKETKSTSGLKYAFNQKIPRGLDPSHIDPNPLLPPLPPSPLLSSPLLSSPLLLHVGSLARTQTVRLDFGDRIGCDLGSVGEIETFSLFSF